MKELVEEIANALVDKPDEVVVNEVGGEQASVLELLRLQRVFKIE